MLVKLTGEDGKDLWINPIHVKVIEATRRGARVYFLYSGAWGANHAVKVQQDAATAADLLNAGMPDLLYPPPDDPLPAAPKPH